MTDLISRAEALKAIQQWRTGCPDESGEYIVMIKGARRSTFLLYDEESDIWHDEAGNFYTVTHWMPLPEPPER